MRIIKHISFILSLIITIIFIFQPQFIRAEISIIIYVDDDNIQGPWDGTQQNPYQTIEDAVYNATQNSTIYVQSGSYYESLNINISISLIGDNKTTTIINGKNNFSIININASNIQIQGFTFTNTNLGLNIKNCSNSTITKNTLIKLQTGIIFSNSTQNNTIYYNNFINNNINAIDYGNNTWYDESQKIGNFWDTHSGNDFDNDGIYDNPYTIIGKQNQDIYPFIQPFTILPQPQFTYLPLQSTTQDSIQFTDQSTDIDGTITSWLWVFGDDTTSNSQNPTHKYQDNGLFNVSLTVTDNYGATNTVTQQITIFNSPPTVSFIFYPFMPTDIEEVLFNDTSIDLDGDIVKWKWDFGDGNTSNLSQSTHTYEDDGIYTITLNVTDDDGATSEISKQIQILNVKPVARFSYNPEKPIINESVNFLDYSIDFDGEITKYNWDFGDGTSSKDGNPSHNYKKAATYQVNLEVTDDDGETESVSKFVIIYPPKKPNETGIESIIIYIVYIVLFIVMIAFVFMLKKKVG